MDNQDHKKNQTSGHESYGVHLCHKCGWPFPNPHPSARHRRAHRKICGTIEGYKLVDSQSTISDDELASDDDLKTPSPKLLERSNNKRGSGGIGERSNRSEDEVFADAVAEFPDSGSNLANEESVEKVKQLGRLTIIESFKDAESTDTFPLPEISAESNQLQNVEASESILSADKWETPDHVMVNATLGLDIITSEDKQIKGSAHDPIDAKQVSACNICPAKAETETGAAKSSINSIDVCNLRQVDAKGDEEINSGRNVLDAAFSSSDHSSTEMSNVVIVPSKAPISSPNQELAKVVIVPSKAAISSPNQELANAGFQFNEVQNNVDYKMPSNDIFPYVGTVEVTDDTSHTAENRENASAGMHSTASGNSGQVYYGKGEWNKNVHTFSVSDDIPTVDDSEIMIKGFKDHKDGKLPHYVNTDALEIIDCIKDSHAKDDSSISQSELCDEATAASVSEIHVSEGYYDYKGLRSNDEAISTGLLSSDSHGSKGYLDQKGMSSNPVEVFPSEAETVSENKLEEIGSNADAMAVGMEPRDIAQLPEESVSHAYSEDSSLIASLSQHTKVLPNVNSVGSPIDAAIGQATNVVYLDNVGKIDEAKAERTDAADHDYNRRVTVDQDMENIIANSELVSISSENEVSARVNVHSDNHVVDGEDGQSERHYASVEENTETDSGSKLMEENCAGQENTAPESAGDNQNLQVFSENAINVHEKLPESEYTPVSVSGTQLNEIESGGNKNVHLEFVGVNKGAGAESLEDVTESCEVSADAILPQIKIAETEYTLSDRILNTKEGLKELVVDDTDKVNAESVEAGKSESDVKAELAENSTEDKDHEAEELRASPSDVGTSVQSSGTIDHNNDKEFAKASSADKPQSLLDENDCAQQHTASVTDFSVDSSSQNSVEGHWGSVSVLSTISDIPAITDAESLPSNGLQVSTDREKASSNKQKAEAKAPHSEKADMFEPPSFMTLVEPESAKSSASEIQNPQQSAGSLQAGWFPSLTHVVNESQGRKKNEEIIAKVTNWSTGKQHTPLKNLLGEAKVEGKPKSPNVKENQPQVETTQNDTSVTTVSSILGPQDPMTDPGKKDTGREWNSPARYPADIKREKRKVKGRPYWAQFVCCSSVN